MKATIRMVPLAVLAITFASCGVVTNGTFNADGRPTPTGTIDPVPSPESPTLPGTGDSAGDGADDTPAPIGKIDDVDVVIPGFATVTGWADNGDDANPTAVTAWLDGAPMATTIASYHAPQAPTSGGGFAFDLPVAEGTHSICVMVTSNPASPIDCVDFDSAGGTGTIDSGSVYLTAVTPDREGSVTVRGVMTGSDGSAPPTLGVRSDAGVVTAMASDDPVTRVEIVHQSFRFRVDQLDVGTWSICPTPWEITVQERALTPAAGDGCGTVVIGESVAGGLHIGTTGRAIDVSVVAPTPDHPLYRMERDAGVSVAMSDGSTIWFFGDTAERRPDGGLVYFVNNTAAWAAVDAPTVTRDAVSASGAPILFAAPPPGACAESPYPKAALWPEAAAAIPLDDGTDRVVVVMSKVCLGSTWLEFETVGYALAEFVYDPNDPPADRAITGEVTQPDLASVETGYGRALMLLPDGFLYGYHCGEFPDSWGPCQVGRVVTGEVAETASWRYWNGDDWTDPDSWVPDRSDAGAMDVPGAEVNTLPVAAFGVVRDDRHDAYLMVYSPWPAFCSELAVRVADTPVGPWSEPVPITLPGCRQEVAGLAQHCYAATPQMQLCGADEFGGGYFDLKTDAGIGQYLAFVAPFIVVRSEP